MDIKSNLFANLNNKPKTNITFIETDLLNTSSLQNTLITHGWNPNKTTLPILEGISYYLPPKVIKNIVQSIKPNQVIFEFLKQDKEIANNRKEIPKKIFNLIAEQCKLSHIFKYNSDEIEALLDMHIIDKYSTKQLESIRTGVNNFFPTENSGWIEISSLTQTHNI